MVTQPTQPAYSSSAVPGVAPADFRVGADGLPPETIARVHERFLAHLSEKRATFLGYQTDQELEYKEVLKDYLNFHLNNVGDPFQPGNFTINSKWLERAVLDYYAALWNARWPHDDADPESYWGYITSMGSTEGNMYALWNARDYLSGKALHEDFDEYDQHLVYQLPRPATNNPNAYTPVLFYSSDTHYSIVKDALVLGIQTFHSIARQKYGDAHNPLHSGRPWPSEVPSTETGQTDLAALAKLVEFFAAEGYPILICLNYGTTFKGAYDDVARACDLLAPIFERYGLVNRQVRYDETDPYSGRPVHDEDIRAGFWLHVDGALGAAHMPFMEMARAADNVSACGPVFDFRLPQVSSISMSGHKWIGAPWPCGIYMTRTKLQLRAPADPVYIGARDSTFAGSRNGLSAVVFWQYLATHSFDRQIRKAVTLAELAGYAHERLQQLQADRAEDLWVERSPLALTVRFRRPSEDIVRKYSLSNERLLLSGTEREYSHIYIMEHVTADLIDALVRDLGRPDAFPRQRGEGAVVPRVRAVPGSEEISVPYEGRGFR
ncbi:MAG: histidine decarboxylase [Chloroflexi bacterium]|nr:histidine decarboxylase [Chloroflexota bacterium]